MKVKKRILSFVSLLTALCTAVAVIAMVMPVQMTAEAITFDNDLKIYSEAVYMISLDTDDVVYSKNSDQQRVPASLTKIMTCLLVLEANNGDEDVLRSKTAVGGYDAFNELEGTGCSNADIKRGEEVNYYDLLCALMVPSGCEAANILAIDMCGSIDAFVEKMNLKAAEIGMTNTHYSNTHGLFAENNYTTCEDIALLTKYVMNKYDLFMTICNQAEYDMSPTKEHPDGTHLITSNKMLVEGSDYYYRFAKGIKTGFLDAAGRCLVSTATRNGYTYLIVSMGAPAVNEEGEDTMYNCIDHATLYEWAFENLEYATILDTASEMGEVPVEYGKGVDHVTVKPSMSYSQLWPKNVDKSQIKQKITLNQSVVAPVTVGQPLGSIELTYDGQTVAKIDLVSTAAVERDEIKSDVKVAASFKDSAAIKIAIIVAVGAVLLYVLIFAAIMVLRRNRRRDRYYDDDDDDYDDDEYDDGDE